MCSWRLSVKIFRQLTQIGRKIAICYGAVRFHSKAGQLLGNCELWPWRKHKIATEWVLDAFWLETALTDTVTYTNWHEALISQVTVALNNHERIDIFITLSTQCCTLENIVRFAEQMLQSLPYLDQNGPPWPQMPETFPAPFSWKDDTALSACFVS